MIGGFSAAGWQSSTLPGWLALLGFLNAIGALACGVFIVSVLSNGRAVPLAELTTLGCLAWFLITGVLMAFRGAAGGKENAGPQADKGKRP